MEIGRVGNLYIGDYSPIVNINDGETKWDQYKSGKKSRGLATETQSKLRGISRPSIIKCGNAVRTENQLCYHWTRGQIG